MIPKSFFSSWTMWFGMLQIGLGVVGMMSGLMDGQAALTLIMTGAGSIGLRFKTSQPIGTPTV